MSISGFVDTIPVSTLQSVSIIESEFVQAALTGRILQYGRDQMKAGPRGPAHVAAVRGGITYFRMISTRRFCGSRTPRAVGTSGLVSPNA